MPTPPKPRRVLGYARVSSVEQAHGTSLADQQERIGREAAHRDVKDVRFYVEAESGGFEKHERREQIHTLLQEARPGDLVIVDKLDRWSRDPELTYRSIRQLREKGVGIFFIAEAIDPSTVQGELALSMWIGFARSEHRRIRERMVGTREGLQAQGYYTIGGKPPFGYRRTDADERLVPFEEEAQIVREIFERYATGNVSQRQLVKELGMGLALIQEILTRRVYIAQVQEPPSSPGKKDGRWIQGKHQALVPLQLFAKVQEMLATRTLGGARPRRGESQTSTWLLRDIAVCARCGKKMRSAYRKPSYYYLCPNRYEGTKTCTAPHVPIGEVEEGVRDGIEEVLEFFMRRMTVWVPEKPKPDRRPNAKAQRKTLLARRDRFVESHAAGVIDLARLKTEVSKIDDEVLELDARISEEAEPSPLSDPNVRRELLRQVGQIQRAVKALTPAELRTIVNTFFVKVRIEKNVRPLYETRSADDVRDHVARLQGMLVKALKR